MTSFNDENSRRARVPAKEAAKKKKKYVFFSAFITSHTFLSVRKTLEQVRKSICCVWLFFGCWLLLSAMRPRSNTKTDKNWCDFDGDIVSAMDGFVSVFVHTYGECVGNEWWTGQTISLRSTVLRGSSLIIISLFIGKWCWARQSIPRLFIKVRQMGHEKEFKIYCLLIEVF